MSRELSIEVVEDLLDDPKEYFEKNKVPNRIFVKASQSLLDLCDTMELVHKNGYTLSVKMLDTLLSRPNVDYNNERTVYLPLFEFPKYYPLMWKFFEHDYTYTHYIKYEGRVPQKLENYLKRNFKRISELIQPSVLFYLGEFSDNFFERMVELLFENGMWTMGETNVCPNEDQYCSFIKKLHSKTGTSFYFQKGLTFFKPPESIRPFVEILDGIKYGHEDEAEEEIEEVRQINSKLINSCQSLNDVKYDLKKFLTLFSFLATHENLHFREFYRSLKEKVTI